MRVGVPVVLEGKVGGDGGHRDPDVRVLDPVALRQLVHDGLRLFSMFDSPCSPFTPPPGHPHRKASKQRHDDE